MLNYLEQEFVCAVLVYICGCRVFLVIGLVPTYVVCCCQDVDQIGEEELRLYSHLIVGEY